MPESQARLGILIDAEVTNLEQLKTVQETMKQLGVTVDQVSERTKQGMAAMQAQVAAQEQAAVSTRRVSTAMQEGERAAQGFHGQMGTLQNVLSNAMVNATMGGGAFSNLAWG